MGSGIHYGEVSCDDCVNTFGGFGSGYEATPVVFACTCMHECMRSSGFTFSCLDTLVCIILFRIQQRIPCHATAHFTFVSIMQFKIELCTCRYTSAFSEL